MGWVEFATAYAAFFLSHSIPVRPPVRPWLRARLGAGGFTLGYSVLSLAVLAWLIGAAGRAPHVALWDWAPWQAHVPLVLMLPVCLILALSIGRPNPLSFGGARNDLFDPAQPGIFRWSRHPLLLALALWAGAHVVPNGDLAHVFLFGTFAAFALLGGRLIDRRKRREMGRDWDRLQIAVANAPRIPHRVALVRLLAGVALYAALLWLHPILFGVSPLP
ncbi:NnrU family protein [Lutimaribacter sp. EGI FJ00015]|uniref:NnrU family protein n=1 Tax=Lutimaribacter degradans TaxID=2945989 RepID=A0ACC5ZSW6_9RHOB|nr:NnrU family protein [Lutimaribacter sp. EGI FJ00013]MCM2561265.1 NnrU family protein [Lutimaribacter sp. EGI FJ00013]MCO0611786.1 NnrU family protein [Lutimaribacter sp. EGI FJ00015]MCO0635093.1 NnrU family protein [Lutimaribacter sp. EGI FJ00014]